MLIDACKGLEPQTRKLFEARSSAPPVREACLNGLRRFPGVPPERTTHLHVLQQNGPPRAACTGAVRPDRKRVRPANGAHQLAHRKRRPLQRRLPPPSEAGPSACAVFRPPPAGRLRCGRPAAPAGADLRGCSNLHGRKVHLFEKVKGGSQEANVRVMSADDPQLKEARSTFPCRAVGPTGAAHFSAHSIAHIQTDGARAECPERAACGLCTQPVVGPGH